MDYLVLYASREGQTRRIAEAIAAEWCDAGKVVGVLAVDDPQAVPALAAARVVVLGASIHYGRLPAAFYRFVSQHRALLDARQNAFFCVNLTARKPGKDTPEGSVYIRTFRRRSVWRPQRIAVMAGALLYPRYAWYDRQIIRFIMWLTGGPTDPLVEVEYTDWDKVRAFARTLLQS